MRTLLLLGLAIGGAFMAGWFTIEKDGDRTRIEINKTEIRSDTRQAINKGKVYLDQREQERLAQQQQQQGGVPGPANWQQQPQGNWNQPSGNYAPNAYQNGNPVQGAGYVGQTPYGQPGYGNQPAPNYSQPAGQPRYSEMPPPWQQQTR